MKSKNCGSLIRISQFLAVGLLALSLIAPVAMAQVQFSGPTNYPVGTAPVAAAVGDFNGDGKQDLVVVNSGSGDVSILLGNGDGTFQPAVNYNAGSSPAFVAVGDFNGDGKLDLAVANGSANTVSVLLGNGDGTFQAPVQYNVGASADYIAVAGFNNDNKLDVLISSTPVGPLYKGTISILLGNGDGKFQSPITTSITSFEGPTALVAIADFNGDGKLDIATGNATVSNCVPNGSCTTNGNVIILLGNGDGTFQPPVTSSVAFQPTYLTTGDFNGDGKFDLAIVGTVFQEGEIHQVIRSQVIGILLGAGDGTFSVSDTVGLPRASGILVFPHNPFAPNVAVADLNNDGKVDIIAPVVIPDPSIVGGQTSAIWAFLGNGDGTFQPAQKFNLATAPSWLSVGDLNGDTLPDLAATNSSANSVSIFLNTTPTFPLSLTVAGDGGGIVTSQPAVINCQRSCVGNFAPGTTVTLTAASNATSNFTGWSGACSGTGACSVTMNAAESVGATFDLVTFPLTVSFAGTGKGTVTSSPAGINCGSACSAVFAKTTIVTLTANAATGSIFSGWSGACSGTGACSVTMSAAESVSAAFNPPPDFSLSPASANLTAQRGGQVTDVITLAPQNGSFGSAIQLTCAVTGPSPMPTCVLSATSVTPGANSASSTLTINAPALAAMLGPSVDQHLTETLYAIWLPLPGIVVIGIGFVSRKQRDRRRNLWLLAGSLLALFAVEAGCGGGSNTPPPPPPQNYTITVTGSSGAIQHTTQVTVTVQ